MKGSCDLRIRSNGADMEMGDMPFAVDKGAYEESVGIRPENWSNRNQRHHES
jgi:hypothetical protein